ncbi:MAG: N-acetylmuramoyl-L-alanine amidase [Janthinobacterium lividum]
MRTASRWSISGACLLIVAALGCSPTRASSTHPSWQQPVDAASPPAGQSGIPVAVDAKLNRSGDVTRLVIDLNTKVSIAAVLTEHPDRLVVDLPEVNFQVDPAAGRPEPGRDGLIRAFRFGVFAPGRSRIVADLAGPAVLRRAEVSSIAGGHASHLTLELAPTDRAAFHAAARPPQALPGADLSSRLAEPATGHPVVVIDPGHGGLDPGASGVLGTVEKDVVLHFATALAARLAVGDHYRVVMTRHDDSFVSLSDRMRIARDAEASLMISVHADTLSDGSVTGATVYTAADQASDGEAARVAAKENEADAAAGLDEAPKAADVSDILFDLTRRETRTYAHQFQRTLTGYWSKVAHLNHNPERAAGFKVLQAPDVPSVLLELGYLSSGTDARLLVSDEWRGKAVDSVAAAVDTFFSARAPSPATVVGTPPGPAAMR